MEKGAQGHRCQVTLMYILGIEYIICSMASRCASAKSDLNPEIAEGCYQG